MAVARPDADEVAELLAEVEHDVGNLMHRMFYWCEVLDQSLQADASVAEAGGELRESVAELYRLVGRATDLVRPLEVRTFRVGVGEVCRRVFQRLGCRERVGEELLEGVGDCEVKVDPMPLDRALDMIAEMLGCADNAQGLEVRAELRVAGSDDAVRQLHLDLRPPADHQHRLGRCEPGGASERICRCVAGRVLRGFGWQLEARLDGALPRCTLSIPLVVTGES